MGEGPIFDDLLDTTVGDATRPPPIPAGTWTLLVREYKSIKSDKKGTPGVQVDFNLVSPGDDVDPDQFSEFSTKVDVGKKNLSNTFWMTENSAYRLREFIEHCGVDHIGKTFRQILPDIVGTTVVAYISQTPSKKPGSTDVFNEITSFSEAS